VLPGTEGVLLAVTAQNRICMVRANTTFAPDGMLPLGP